MHTGNHYTFGDNERAARRLRLLADAYEAPTRAFLESHLPPRVELALDLGSGPGHTTRLLHSISRARRTIGLEASTRYVAEARASAPVGVEFLQHDVTAATSEVPAAELVFCRFLLTHLADPTAALHGFRGLVAQGGALLIQEIADMASEHPALARYYELVARLQAHYGQTLHIGRHLERLAEGSPFQLRHFQVRRFQQPAATMAELHALNLQTWRVDAFAQSAFDRAEIDELDRRLQAIASGEERVPPISMALGELVLG